MRKFNTIKVLAATGALFAAGAASANTGIDLSELTTVATEGMKSLVPVIVGLAGVVITVAVAIQSVGIIKRMVRQVS